MLHAEFCGTFATPRVGSQDVVETHMGIVDVALGKVLVDRLGDDVGDVGEPDLATAEGVDAGLVGGIEDGWRRPGGLAGSSGQFHRTEGLGIQWFKGP